MIDFQNIALQTVALAKEVAIYIKSESKGISADKVEVKGLHDFVTHVDKNAEIKLVEGLQRILPDAGFITEENTLSNRKHYTWVVDPLDGTTNFIHSVPCFCISIALLCEDEVVVGVIHEINLKESFYAWKGSKAYLNGKEIAVSVASRLEDALLVTGFPNRDYSRLDEYMELFRYFMENTHGVRRFGSAAADLAYVACGRCEGFYEYGLSPWDVAAGALIVECAGGKVTDFNGGDNYIFGEDIIAGNSAFFPDFLLAVKKYLSK